jgi:EAL domain-containing protein (putative c-di-GMP-specific phosphodiesterase class I)
MALAHKLDMHVVAEGVETAEQHRTLAACDCDLFQGFLFSRPLPARAATEFMLGRH